MKKEKRVPKEIIELIDKSKKIALVTHSKPDGDGLGSLLAMRLALLLKMKIVKIFCIDSFNSIYDFLPGISEIDGTLDLKGFELVIFLDCASLSQAGLKDKKLPSSPSINIDHHFTNDKFADLNFVDHSVGSTSEIAYKIILDLGVEIDKDIATCLLTGVYCDTGGFIHANTSISNLLLASELLLKGGQSRKIFRNIYGTKPLCTLRIHGKVLANVKQKNKGLTYSVITRKEMLELGAKKEELEGAIDLVRLVPKTKVALFIYEEEEGFIKGSLRTDDDNIDVSHLAGLFGGGGHKKASGFRIRGKLEDNNSETEIVNVVLSNLKS